MRRAPGDATSVLRAGSGAGGDGGALVLSVAAPEAPGSALGKKSKMLRVPAQARRGLGLLLFCHVLSTTHRCNLHAALQKRSSSNTGTRQLQHSFALHWPHTGSRETQALTHQLTLTLSSTPVCTYAHCHTKPSKATSRFLLSTAGLGACMILEGRQRRDSAHCQYAASRTRHKGANLAPAWALRWASGAALACRWPQTWAAPGLPPCASCALCPRSLPAPPPAGTPAFQRLRKTWHRHAEAVTPELRHACNAQQANLLQQLTHFECTSTPP